MQKQVYHSPVYDSQSIQLWEQRWFQQKNNAYGVMQQVAWSISQRLMILFKKQKNQKIAVCCGQGNNAGDGYLIAKYLKQAGFNVDIYAAERGQSVALAKAQQEALESGLEIHFNFDFSHDYDAYIDALFGIGLNRDLNESWQSIIQSINKQQGLKIAIDIPSGLNANTGRAMPCCIRADLTYTVLALKVGLFTGQGKEFVGKLEVISIIPTDDPLNPTAYLSTTSVQLPKREAYGHKGSYGHVLVIGGHANMGGAVIMAAEAAFASGAGKVTVMCDAKHHTAILSRAPNIMLADINTITHLERLSMLNHIDAVCFGMGIGRDAWAKLQYDHWFDLIQQADIDVVLDADALWFLAEQPQKIHAKNYLTPHPGEAAKLLGTSTAQIENDRVAAIYQLQEKYAGQWVLKGSGSLILENDLYICTAGNAGMGTGGMGDVLAGMIASLKAQFHENIGLHEIVTLHALAGDELAKNGERGLQASDMKMAIYQVVNNERVVGKD